MTSTAGSPHQVAARATDRLRRAGKRRTPGRVAMLGILASSGSEHLTAVEIHRRLHAAGWESDHSAVHRALAAFTELGLIHALPTPGPPAYGLSDPEHHHTLCERCGAVTEVPASEISDAVAAIAAAVTFRIAVGGLSLRGVCIDCQQVDRG